MAHPQTPSSPPELPITDVRAYVERHRARFVDELTDLLRIPSVSTDPERREEVRRAAEFLLGKLAGLGFQTELLETPGHPVVYAERHVSDNLPTVLVYGHYDVQPPEPLELWAAPPFEPTVRDGKLYARGASDDKGQVYAHVKGVEALLALHGTPPLNVKFLIEGEEEIGSPNLLPLIETHRERFAADVVLISDGAMVAPETPTITYGLKGLAYVEVWVRGAAMDLHSGAFGGAAPNPINGLAKMIAALHDASGRVAVPGFYDAVVDLTPEEREVFGRAPFDEVAFARELGVSALPGEAGYTVLERLWARPTLDCNGIGGGFQGEGSKTVIPSQAMAKLSCRLVPNQTPEEITRKLSDYLKALAPEGLSVEVKDLHGGDPVVTPLTSKAVQAAGRALEAVYGRPVVFARTGGTIPVASTFQKVLGADVVFVGMGLEGDRAHSPNEKFDLVNYYRGIETSAALFRTLAAV
jgi:acetylornithine deacetylase/succinyl-diaminopimelate desuccinylase-like protein